MSRWLVLLSIVLLGVVVAAFTLQNASYTSPLQLDLYVVAWRLREPASVPALVWTSFGAGFALAGMWGLWRSSRLAARLRKLEQEVALSSAAGKGPDPWAR